MCGERRALVGDPPPGRAIPVSLPSSRCAVRAGRAKREKEERGEEERHDAMSPPATETVAAPAAAPLAFAGKVKDRLLKQVRATPPAPAPRAPPRAAGAGGGGPPGRPRSPPAGPPPAGAPGHSGGG